MPGARESCVGSGAQQLLAAIRVLDEGLNLRAESTEEFEGTLTVQVPADELQHVVVRLEVLTAAKVQAQERNTVSVTVLRVVLEVVEEGGEGVPKAQHLGGLHSGHS